MSHFTSIQTQIVEREFLLKALADLGHQYEEGQVDIRGYEGNTAQVEIKIPTKSRGYDIGFRKSGTAYELVADWWGIKGIDQKLFLQQLTQRYAYHATRARLEEQGFSIATEEKQKDGKLHLVLRRMS